MVAPAEPFERTRPGVRIRPAVAHSDLRRRRQRFFFSTPSMESAFSVGFDALVLGFSALGLRSSLFDFFRPLAMRVSFGLRHLVRRRKPGAGDPGRNSHCRGTCRTGAPGMAQRHASQIGAHCSECKACPRGGVSRLRLSRADPPALMLRLRSA